MSSFRPAANDFSLPTALKPHFERRGVSRRCRCCTGAQRPGGHQFQEQRLGPGRDALPPGRAIDPAGDLGLAPAGKLAMLPARWPSQITALTVMSGELLTLAMCASKAFRSSGSWGVKAAIRTPSGSRICSNNASRSPSSTGRSATTAMCTPPAIRWASAEPNSPAFGQRARCVDTLPPTDPCVATAGQLWMNMQTGMVCSRCTPRGRKSPRRGSACTPTAACKQGPARRRARAPGRGADGVVAAGQARPGRREPLRLGAIRPAGKPSRSAGGPRPLPA